MCRPAAEGDLTVTRSPSRFRVLLDDDGVGAGRHHAAGEDARGLSGADLAVERPARRDLADQLQRRRHLRDIGGAHRIAVHRRHVGRRLGAQRRDIGGQHAAFGFDQRRVLARQRLDAIEHAGERVSDQQQ